MKHEIFDTQSIWEYVHSEENKKDIAEMNGMEVDEVSDESLWEDERIAYDNEKEYLASEIKAFIERYENRYRTSISNIVFIGNRSSGYGLIGGNGRKVGKEVESTDLYNMVLDYDRIAFYITEEEKLMLVTVDHDGTNYMEMVLVTENEQKKSEELYEDIRVIIDDKCKNSTKLDKEFMYAFGYSKSKIAWNNLIKEYHVTCI